MIRPTLFSVRISSASFVAAGVLKSVARGIIQVLTTAAVPVRCPLQIAIAGCRPTSGEAIYSLRGPSGCQVGIVLPSHPKPALEPGTPAIIHDLEAPYTGHDGTVLNVRNNRLSILSETNVALGGWVRVELADWVLFGVVREVMCAATTGRWLEIHLHAAFAADAPNPGGAL